MTREFNTLGIPLLRRSLWGDDSDIVLACRSASQTGIKRSWQDHRTREIKEQPVSPSDLFIAKADCFFPPQCICMSLPHCLCLFRIRATSDSASKPL